MDHQVKAALASKIIAFHLSVKTRLSAETQVDFPVHVHRFRKSVYIVKYGHVPFWQVGARENLQYSIFNWAQGKNLHSYNTYTSKENKTKQKQITILSKHSIC